MDSFNILVMLKNGSFSEYEVRNNRKESFYSVLQKGEPVATFEASKNGTWAVTENPGNIDEDLKERISKQLEGYHI